MKYNPDICGKYLFLWPKDDVKAAPSRGAVADLKDIEAKIENLEITEEAETNEKEDGEITHECNDTVDKGEIICPFKPSLSDK